jgi:hypothetical protein
MIYFRVEMTELSGDRMASQAVLCDSFGEYDRGEIFEAKVFGDRAAKTTGLHALASDDGWRRAKDENERIAAVLEDHLGSGSTEMAFRRILELVSRLERRVAVLEEERSR